MANGESDSYFARWMAAVRRRYMLLQRVDPLTGLHDRDFFLQRMESLLRNATQSSDNFAVLFVDLDNFKAVNDRLGTWSAIA